MVEGFPGQRRVFRVGQALLVVFAVIVGIPLVVPPVVDALLAVGVVAPDSAGLLLARTVLQYGTFAAIVAIFLLSAGDRQLLQGRVPIRREALLIAGGVGALLGGQYLLLELFGMFGLEPGQNPVITGDHEASYFLGMVVVSVLVVGPAEELLFRGVVQGLLRRAWGAPGAIAIATAVFGVAHYSVAGTFEEKVVYVAIAALLGGLLGALYEYTGNLVVPALTHGGYNALLFGLQYLEKVGLLG